jgi:cytochrome P450
LRPLVVTPKLAPASPRPGAARLTVRFVTERLSSGRADLVRDLAWELPALVIIRVLGIPDDDVARVKAGAESRLLFMWGRPQRPSRSDWRMAWRHFGGMRRRWWQTARRNPMTISRATSSLGVLVADNANSAAVFDVCKDYRRVVTEGYRLDPWG